MSWGSESQRPLSPCNPLPALSCRACVLKAICFLSTHPATISVPNSLVCTFILGLCLHSKLGSPFPLFTQSLQFLYAFPDQHILQGPPSMKSGGCYGPMHIISYSAYLTTALVQPIFYVSVRYLTAATVLCILYPTVHTLLQLYSIVHHILQCNLLLQLQTTL